MPLPAILGLPAAIAWFSSTFTAIVAWVATNLTRKIAVLIAALVAISVAVNQLISYFTSTFAQLVMSAPPELVSAGYVLPSNTVTCITIIISSEIACAVYSMTMRLISLKVEAVS